ncbi:MAG: hypothetical protein H6R10_2277 [Rhodocyclaceae bacterium]|nr:hypothetical protein [Rhodocyclaceae bacterium]
MNLHIIAGLRAALVLLVLSLPFAPSGAYAKSEQEIDAGVDAALAMFKKDVKGAEDYLKGAKGVLVMPNVTKAGFVIGGQSGQGALRIDGKTVGYYQMGAGSIGFQAGYQEANFVYLFLTQEALDNFRASNKWTAGMDFGITVVDVGTGASLDTLKAKSSIVAFAFGKRGLMGGWSAKGTKFTKLPSSKATAQ